MTIEEELEAALTRLERRDGARASKLASMRPYTLGLAQWVASKVRPGCLLTIGINGAQGSGKSTLATVLHDVLENGAGLRTVVLSIDDFYRTRAERQCLAREVHPLLATRGVPGTHDVALARHVLARLRALGRGETLTLPAFIKAHDDRAPESDGPRCAGPIDVVLFEGWCIGTPAQAPSELNVPVNALEASEDGDARWRHHVNEQLRGPYAELFDQLDALIMLKAPSFEIVHAWRLEQEEVNAAQVQDGRHVMSSAELHRFIAHYERLTRHALNVLPARADVVVELDERRRVGAVRHRAPIGDCPSAPR